MNIDTIIILGFMLLIISLTYFFNKSYDPYEEAVKRHNMAIEDYRKEKERTNDLLFKKRRRNYERIF